MGRGGELSGVRRWPVGRWVVILFAFPAVYWLSAWVGLSISTGSWVAPDPAVAAVVFAVAAGMSFLVFFVARSLIHGFSMEFLSSLAGERRPPDQFEVPPFRLLALDGEGAIMDQANLINRARLEKAGRKFSGKRALWAMDTVGQLPWVGDAGRAAMIRSGFIKMKAPARPFLGCLIVVAVPSSVEDHEKPKQFFEACGVLLDAVERVVAPQGGTLVHCAGTLVAAAIPAHSRKRLPEVAMRAVRVARDLLARLEETYPGRDALVLADLSVGHEVVWFGDANLRYQCETPELWAVRLGQSALAGGGLRLSQRLVSLVRTPRSAGEVPLAE